MYGLNNIESWKVFFAKGMTWLKIDLYLSASPACKEGGTIGVLFHIDCDGSWSIRVCGYVSGIVVFV